MKPKFKGVSCSLLVTFFTFPAFSNETALRQKLESEIIAITEKMYESNQVRPQDLASIENLQARLSIIRSIERGYSERDEIKISQRTFNVLFLDNIGTLYLGAQFGPEKDGDSIIGYKLSRVDPTHIFHILGFKQGDILMSIDDISLTDEKRFKDVLEKMKASRKGSVLWQVKLAIYREGRMILKIFKISPNR